ncbi:ubiquitin-like domain-containing protein [Streptomyces sp. NPDC004111]|uniref:ubiquitin-like domain-containing protein n=1 Tax=Streptomyces sp. NPDC004111 TaxID=3364690 RepID=UPI00369EC6A0
MSNTQSGALSYGEQYGEAPYGESYGDAPYGSAHPPYDTYQPSYGTYEGRDSYENPGTADAYGAYGSAYGYEGSPHGGGTWAQDHPGGIPGPASEPDLGGAAPGGGPDAHPDSRTGVAPGADPDEHEHEDAERTADAGASDAHGAAGAGGRAGGRAGARAEGRADGRRAARRRKGAPAGSGGGSERPDTLRKLVPQALVVAFLAGGTSAFVANDKSIELIVDGAPRTLHTFADDVTELLEKEGVAVGEHDLVAPGRGQTLASGDEVVVRYGRPVTLNLDGERRQVWTTAQTVEGALRQLGVRAEGAYLSASRSSPISRRGLALDVRTERTLTVMADGRERTIRTNAATVGEAVEEAGISLANQDTTSVPLESFPRDGQTVTVMRITGSREVVEEPIDFRVIRKDDPTVFKGTEEVVRPGVKGARRVTYVLRTVNGVKQKPKRYSEEIAREPVDQVVKVGTKPMPTAVEGADHLNWEGLAQCESGGRPGATDPTGTYGGLYQFDRQTWQSLGGSGAAHEAPASEQTFRAKKLYVQRGASPWPHCGKKL